jgi:UDPglucose 6-dehydrogenase
MRITVVGLGYVGLVTATCLARMGQRVIGLESDRSRIRALESGRTPFYEPHLQGELALQRDEGRLSFTSTPSAAFRGAEAILICVGTPSLPSGEADLAAVNLVVDAIADHLETRAVVALRSTVPVGTTRRTEARLNQRLSDRGGASAVPIVANPEFLRTGRALEDFLHPSRVVLGRTEVAHDDDIELLATLYRPLEAPIHVFDAESAELVKNAANAYLAMRISFSNELAALCQATGASVSSVITGIGSDPRIGEHYLRPGLGYGGSCLPKDVRSLISMGKQHGSRMELSEAVDRVNAAQPLGVADSLEERIGTLKGARIALLGLAFKPDTDDIRDSPALALARELRKRGAEVVGCDPQATHRVAEVEPWIRLVDAPSEAARGADAVVMATEWPEYVTLDLTVIADAMRGRFLMDGRNALDPARASSAGLTYLSIGGPPPAS